MADFLNGKIGLGSDPSWVLGPMQVVRAEAAIDYDNGEWNEELGEYVYPEIDGWTYCLTEVIPWPFAEDEEGVAFDQSNLVGVRTRTWRRPMADGGGDSDEYWTAVPKSLPDGYTPVNRGEGILTGGFYADYLGDDLMGPKDWNHRTPTGLLWNDTTDPDQLRRKWAPMNQSQRVATADTGDAFSGNWDLYTPEDFYSGFVDCYWVSQIASIHVGFRNAKVVWTYGVTGSGVGSATFEVISVRADEFWDPIDCDNPPPSLQILASGSVSITGGTPLPHVLEIELGELIPDGLGIPFNFFIRYEADASFVPIFGTNHHFILSPRTDVPLHYSASMKNNLAPGGIIEP